MTMQDPIADLLTRIRNAQRAKHATVVMPMSKLKVSICEVLEAEGYIGSVTTNEGVKPEMEIELRYHGGEPVICELDRSSRPGLRSYKDCENLPKVRNGLGVAIISTNRGVMTDQSARAAGIGGEVLCTVF